MSHADEPRDDLLDAYVHGMLSEEKSREVERRCEESAEWRDALAAARRRLRLLESLPAAEASEELINETLDGVERRRRGDRRWKAFIGLGSLGTLAAAVLVLAVLQGYYTWLTPTPYNLTLLGQSELLVQSDAAVRLRLVNQNTGKLLARVPVVVELIAADGRREKLAETTTDDHGIGEPSFQVPDWAEGPCELRITALPDGKPEILTRSVVLRRAWKLMLSSDKPVYQPGQTIHLRALALHRPHLRPVAGQEAVFTLTDPKGNVLFKERAQTSRFGIVAADCLLATEILEGAYLVRCQMGSTTSEQTVTVSRYVLPKFKVSVELDQKFYQPAQVIQGKVVARYFFGKPVSNGTVAVELRTDDVGVRVLQRQDLKTNAAGEAEFRMGLPANLVGLPTRDGQARVQVVALVRDAAGQEQTHLVSRAVTTQPIHIEVIPESGMLVQGVENRVYVFTSYPDGRPARVSLSGTGIAAPVQSSELGVATVVLKPEEQELRLTLRAEDAEKRVGRRNLQLNCGRVSSDFIARTDRAVYQGGDTATIQVLGGGVEPVFIDLLKDGQTVLSRTIDVKDGKGELAVDLPADLFGTLELCAYRFGPVGLAVRKSRVLFVRAADQLRLSAKMARPEYRPGEKATLQLTLTDKDGKPAPGAVSLAAVDEAVFSVLTQAPGTEKTFYTLEQELLQPVYTIYPWSPDGGDGELPPPERDAFEQALFARTWHTAGAVDLRNPPAAAARPGARRDNPHSLVVQTLPIKEQETQATKKTGLLRVNLGWQIVAVATVLLAYINLWVFLRWWIVLILHGVGLAFLCGGAVVLFLFLQMGPSASRTFEAVGAKMDMAGAENAPMAMARDAMRPRPEAKMEDPDEAASAEPLRVRDQFPETLLWRPELVTDDQGKATLEIELADSITTWKLAASAVTTGGQLGSAVADIKVFQPFFVDLNLPVSFTRGDEASVPVVVYNYLDKPQTVELELAPGDGIEAADGITRKLELAPGEVKSLSYRLVMKRVGRFPLQVTARAAGVADAVRRDVEIVPDGKRVEQVVNGALGKPAELTLEVPAQAIEGSPVAVLKLYGTRFSQLNEGLDGIFRQPYGCFEQTSSTTYPNILALDYLRRTNTSAPDVEAKARQYIHLGYQRLVGFEVPGGGFDWFGNPPANRRLTAYGLLEFRDMARVHDVDPNLIARTRQWLLRQRAADGSWQADPGLHEENNPARGQQGDMARYVSTAYIAWAVYGGDDANGSQPTREFLLTRTPAELQDDPYTLALVARALVAMDPNDQEARKYLDQLDAVKKTSEDGKLVWWEVPGAGRTAFYGAGNSAHQEATALATLAFLTANHRTSTAAQALDWLLAQRGSNGTWNSTQATVLALQSLVASTEKTLGDRKDHLVRMRWADGDTRDVAIPADQSEVMQMVDLSDRLRPGQTLKLTVSEASNEPLAFQVAFRHHVPVEGMPEKPEGPLAVQVEYDRTDLAVGNTIAATATVTNRMTQTAPMVMLDLPIPPGFAVEGEEFQKLVSARQIARFQTTPRQVIVYLRALAPGQTLKLSYHLRATMPVQVAVPGARVYEYYDADKEGRSKPVRFTVAAPAGR